MQPGCIALQPGCIGLQGGEHPRRTCSQAEAFHSARVCSHGTAHALCAAAAKSSALRKTVPVCGASRSSRAT